MRASTEYRYPSETTPLMEACSAGHVEVVKALIESGADVNNLSASQNTALIYASAAGQFEVPIYAPKICIILVVVR